MANDDLTLDDIRKMAAEIGLTRLTEEHLQQLLVSTRAARARRDALPIGHLLPADEPSHVFRLDPKAAR
jgi:ribonuclease D